jgi:hypothetical protein
MFGLISYYTQACKHLLPCVYVQIIFYVLIEKYIQILEWKKQEDI